MSLRDVASDYLVTVYPGDSIDKAIALMEEHDIHHLPVVERNVRRVVGIVSDRDLLSAVGWLSSRDRVTLVTGPVFIGPTRVDEIMSSPVRVLAPHDHIEQAARLMLDAKISAVPLVGDDCLEGIVTETDFLKCYLDHRSIASNSSWRFSRVVDHMAANVFSLKPKDGIRTARRIMREKAVRHLPIVDNEKVVGIVSDRDVRKALGQLEVECQIDRHCATMPGARPQLCDLMSRQVATVRLSTPLAEAADRMVSRRIGALPVTEDDRLVGIVTETDLLRAIVAACQTTLV